MLATLPAKIREAKRILGEMESALSPAHLVEREPLKGWPNEARVLFNDCLGELFNNLPEVRMLTNSLSDAVAAIDEVAGRLPLVWNGCNEDCPKKRADIIDELIMTGSSLAQILEQIGKGIVIP